MGSEVRFGYADTRLGQIHYREAGSGPPLVLFHESPFSGAVFGAALPKLAHRVRAIAPDTPGYGASAAPPSSLSIAGYAERLALFLDALELEQIPLVGSHTGGAIAIQLVVDMPERVPALMVVGCPLFEEEERHHLLERYLKTFTPSSDGEHLISVWSRYQRALGSDTPVELLHLLTTELFRTMSRYDWGYRAAFEFELDRLLPKITCPTLFLVTQGDPLRDKNEQAVALTPDAEGRVIDSPHGQFSSRNPEGFTQEVLSFLERVGYLT